MSSLTTTIEELRKRSTSDLFLLEQLEFLMEFLDFHLVTTRLGLSKFTKIVLEPFVYKNLKTYAISCNDNLSSDIRWNEADGKLMCRGVEFTTEQ